MSLISLIIRTKNEEKWIYHCLNMIYNQTMKNIEIIIVDNNSNDNTINIAKRFPVDHIINIENFKPGKAINDGIRVSTGDFIVCISAHCIPKDEFWLENLFNNFENNDKIAGVYGRQLPVSFTDPINTRDLLLVFGQDKRIQYKDYFFHNANSMFKRVIWEKFPFDEDVTNIEDRVWGKEVINHGLHIVYEPSAAVYHHHGLHQGNEPIRAKGVVSIIEKIDQDILNEIPDSFKPENVNIIALLPIKGNITKDSIQYDLINKTIENIKKSKYINNIYVLSENRNLAFNNAIWLDRNLIDNSENLSIEILLKCSLEKIEENGNYPQSIMYVNYEYINSPVDIFDNLILDAQYKGYETVFPGYIDYGHYWFKNLEDFIQTDNSMKSRNERVPIFKALYGLGCLCSTHLIRKGQMFGGKIGILPIKDLKYTFRNIDLLNNE